MQTSSSFFISNIKIYDSLKPFKHDENDDIYQYYMYKLQKQESFAYNNLYIHGLIGN